MKIFFLSLFFSLTVDASPKRIITLNPALTETIFALGLSKTIVGTVDASDFPDAAKTIARIGSYGKPNIEKIVELKPDIVFTFKEGYDEVTPMLKRANIEQVSYDSRSIDDFKPMVEDLGQRLSANQNAKDLIKEWDQNWRQLKKNTKSLSTMILIEETPLIVAGGDTFISQIIERCGMKNSFENLKSYPTISNETVHQKKFDIVLVLVERLTKDRESQIKKRYARVPKVVFFDPHHLSRLSPRLPVESKLLCQSLGDDS